VTGLGEEVGDLLAQFVVKVNRRIDKSMGTDSFTKAEEDFIDLAERAGEVIADRVELTPERLLMIRAASLYASTYIEARAQRNQLYPPSEDGSEEE